MPIHRFVIRFTRTDDPRSAGLLKDARALGFEQLKLIRCQDIYFIEGQLLPEECNQLALRLLTDPVTQSAEWNKLPAQLSIQEPGTLMIEVALRPGLILAWVQCTRNFARDVKGLWYVPFA